MSRFLTPADVTVPAAEASFTQIEEVPSRGHNLLLKARRYGRWWMLKGLKEAYRTQSAYRIMLQKEFEITVALQHPNIVAVSSFEEVADYGHCIVMEWIDGETLAEWMQEKKPSRAERRKVFLQLLAAVEYVHSRQVAHRDLKPSNVLITRNGQQVKLIDFGLSDADSYAILKQPAGTPGYFSPEQARSHLTDQRNDIYSLGIILQEMRMGWRARSVVSCCKKPLMKRYANVAEMRRAWQRAERAPYYIACACLLVAVAAMWLLPRAVPEGGVIEPQRGDINQPKVSSSEKRSERKETPERTKEETYASSSAASSVPLRLAEGSVQKPLRGLEKGKEWIDQQMAACGMEARIDTLSAASADDVEKELATLIDDTKVAIHAYVAQRAAGDNAITLENLLLLDVSDRYFRPWIQRIIEARTQ